VFVFVLLVAGRPVAAQDERAEQGAAPRRDFAVVERSFVAVIVEDLPASAEWYGRVLGAAEVHSFASDDGSVAGRILVSGGLTVELVRFRTGPARPVDRHPGFFKSGFYVDNIDAAYAWFVANDVEVVGGIVLDDALGARSLVFRDSEGNRLQLFQTVEP
jgi:catechol 2,3-dioxygenase-like lactoylglutathione lyase family enzyme